MRNAIRILLFLIIPASLVAQPSYSGLLKLEKEVTYWDHDSKIIRSEGYLQTDGFTGVGDKYGKWKYYYKDGGMEELSNYYQGKYNGQVKQFYPNGSRKFEGYFFLGVPDSSFKVFYDNGKLAEEGMYNSIADSIRDTTYKYWKIIDYLKPIKVGEWKTYYEDGTPWEVILHKPDDTSEYLMEYYTPSGEHQIVNGNGTIKEFFASGKPKIELNYKNGLKDGSYISWNANGNKKEEGFYVKGSMNGDWVYYYFVSKRIYQKISYLDGKKHGDFIEHLPNDTVALKGHYNNGLKHGLWEYYFETGQMDMTGSFEEDLQEGHWTYYYPNGTLYYQGDYTKGEKHGAWEFYYNNGKMWREGSYRADLKDGVWNFYYENGGDLMQGAFLEDKEHGAWISYYENGQEKDRGSYDHGLMTAIWEGWYPNGKKSYEGQYERDMKTGKWIYYNSKGTVKDEGNYKILNYKEGESVGYNFTLISEQSYKHGPWISYSEIDAKIVSEGNYHRGRQSGIWKYYYPGGKVVAYENSFNNDGKLDGVSKNYSIKGKLISEIGYKDGKKDGDVKTYDKKGHLIQHLIYKNGVKVKDVVTKTAYKYQK